ncbi:MAG: hypothetical protein JSU70_05375, partial [Phycisphaerales bacterium]
NTEIVVIGTEPKTIELSAGLSKEAKQSIPELMRLAFEEITAPSHCRRQEASERPRCGPRRDRFCGRAGSNAN